MKSLFATIAAAFAAGLTGKQRPPEASLAINPTPNLLLPFNRWWDATNGPANHAIPAPPSYYRPPSQRQQRKAARRLNHLQGRRA